MMGEIVQGYVQLGEVKVVEMGCVIFPEINGGGIKKEERGKEEGIGELVWQLKLRFKTPSKLDLGPLTGSLNWPGGQKPRAGEQ